MVFNSSNYRQEYISRINRVIDYINLNLKEELTLDRLADVANFSRFHFHRIFTSMVGETLNTYIKRIRVEKAAALLVGNPKKSITEIALDCGFTSSSALAKAFREAFNISASAWRQEYGKIRPMDSNNRKTDSNTAQEFNTSLYYTDIESQTMKWRVNMKEKMKVNVEAREVPDKTVAYVRHVGPYAGDNQLFGSLFGRLMMWAGPRGLIRFPETQMLTVYHDDPNITDEQKLRISVCLTVPEDTPVDGEIGKMKIEGGQYAVGHFEIAASEYGEAWNALLAGWLPDSGFQCDDRLCYELYLNKPEEHPEKKHLVDIYVPVKPL